jgi:hypothetical protein
MKEKGKQQNNILNLHERKNRTEEKIIEQNTKRAGTYTFQAYLIFHTALMVMHLADPQFEQSAEFC